MSDTMTYIKGPFKLNGELFNGYEDNRRCAKFRDERGNSFDSIIVYHVVTRGQTAFSYVSTNKGLFVYNADAGEVTALSYTLDDMVFMQVLHWPDGSIIDALVGFYPLVNERDEVTGYGARNIAFDEDGTLTYAEITDISEIPSGVTWMRHKNRTDYSVNVLGCPICYKDKDIWFFVCERNGKFVTATSIQKRTLSDVNNIIDAININTLLINANNANHYFVIEYPTLTSSLVQTPTYSSMGVTYRHNGLDDISWYDQHYVYLNGIISTFALVVDVNTSLLSFAYIAFYNSAPPTERIMHHINNDETIGGINGGCVNNAISHRIYTIINDSGYTNEGTVYATRRHIFASSTRLMDIEDNRYAALKYFHDEDTTNYSIIPVEGKTSIFTINASIEIDNEKYGTVLATDFDSIKRLYHIYTNSHFGTYHIPTRQLTWTPSDIMTKTEDVWSFSDITVIDGQAREFVNGIMTTTAMNGPTFDQLYAEIDELRRRIIALENK